MAMLESAEAARGSLFRAVVLAVALASLLLLGVIGVARDNSHDKDFKYLYSAGEAWDGGHNPYRVEVFKPLILRVMGSGHVDTYFGYPPIFAPVAMLFGVFPWREAAWLMTIINVSCAIGLAWLAVRLVADASRPQLASRSSWAGCLLAAVIIGNPLTATTVWSGQTTLLVTIALVAGWYFVQRGRAIPGGLLLGFATIKPQYAALVLLWMLLERRWKTLGAAGAAALLMALYPLILGGPGTIDHWFHDVTLYQATSYNRLGNDHVIGLPSMLAAMGVPPIPLYGAFALTVVLTLGLWRFRDRMSQEDILGILVAMPIVLVFGHWYDFVLLAPLVAALCLHLWHRRWTLWIAAILALMMCLPNRPLERLNDPAVLHWRSAISLVALLTAVCLAIRDNTLPVTDSVPSLPTRARTAGTRQG